MKPQLAAAFLCAVLAARAANVPAGGIGVLLTPAEGPKIVAVRPDSPADRAGVSAGDTITRINDQPTEGMAFTNLWKSLRGEAGSTVSLTVRKYMGGAELDVQIAREPLEDHLADDGRAAPVWTPSAAGGGNELGMILLELKKINERLDRLEKGGGSSETFGSTDMQGPDRKALAEIELPKNPTREDWKIYVQRILDSTAGQHMFSDGDPQVAMLAKVGEENIDLLLDAGGDMGHMSRFHLNRAIQRIATEKSRDKILRALKDNHELAEIVLDRDWQDGAKQTLLDGMDTAYLPTEWIQAVASFKDPSTYDRLLHHFIHGQNRASTYEIINSLPGIPLEKAVADAWKRASRDHVWERSRMAGIAALYGHADALDVMARALRSPDVARNEHLTGQIRASLESSLDASPPPGEDYAAWLDSVRGRLFFDPVAKRFKLR